MPGSKILSGVRQKRRRLRASGVPHASQS